MAYHVGNGIWDGVFAVPNRVCDEHIKLASGPSVKALLLILRHGGRICQRELAAQLGQSVADIQDAVNYWVAQGVLSEDGAPRQEPVLELPPAISYRVEPEDILDGTLQRQAGSGPPHPEPEERVKTLSSSRPRLTTGEINELAAQDNNITYLLQEVQSVMGKPLTPVASSTIASLYSYSGMRPDLILMLVHYCVSVGKGNMRYIERMADDWVDKGIDSHEKAEAEILRLTEKNLTENKVKSLFGIYDRSLVASEKNYIHAWVDELGIDLKLIELAYERAVELKGKLSFPYINGILVNWHKKGIKTPAQAVKEIKSGGRPGRDAEKDSSYNIGELEKMIAGEL